MVMSRTPKNPVPAGYVPKSSNPYKVKTGDTLQGIAQGAGFSWQVLAQFNWGTTDPREINWYLEHFVGCTKTTADGMSYVFDDTDAPGIIYLPKTQAVSHRVARGVPGTQNMSTISRSAPAVVVMKLTLGATTPVQTTPRLVVLGKIYVPTRDSGRLIVKSGSARMQLAFKDGADINDTLKAELLAGQHDIVPTGISDPGKLPKEIKYDVPEGTFGWHYLRIFGAGDIHVRFVQEAVAKDSDGSVQVPWNFWYFPFSDRGHPPHGWDNPGPFTRYDAQFSTSGFDWEENHHKMVGEAAWQGHCHGAVRAAIFFKQPVIPSPNTHGYNQEDLELFSTEYCLQHCKRSVPWGLPGYRDSALHKEIPSKGPGLLNDEIGDFHETLVKVILKDNDACYMDMRYTSPLPGSPNFADQASQVWNQSAYKFVAEYAEHIDAANDEKDIYIVNSITANHDNNGINNGDPETGHYRVQRTLKYRLVFDSSGRVDTGDARQDWEGVEAAGASQFAPRYIMVPEDFSTAQTDGNTNVKFGNLQQLGLELRLKFAGISTP